MYWKITSILLLYSLQSFGYSLPKVKDILPSNVSYQNANNNKVLEVLKKAYSDLNNRTDAVQRNDNFPNTYGLSLHGHQGFVWNTLNHANNHFRVGAKGGNFLKVVKAKDEHTDKPKLRRNLSGGSNVKQSPQTVAKHDDKLNNEKEDNANEQNNIQELTESEKGEKFFFQIIDELLEDEEFWDWLADLTEVYTELLDEHIKTSVNEEVNKQIKEYFDKIDLFLNNCNREVEEKNDQKCGGRDKTSLRKSDSTDFDSENDDKNEGTKGFVNTQYFRNSSVHNEYITNLYITNSKARKEIKGEKIDMRTGDGQTKNNETDEENVDSNESAATLGSTAQVNEGKRKSNITNNASK